jgi:hypothetical protein
MHGRAIIPNYTEAITASRARQIFCYACGVSATGVTYYLGAGSDDLAKDGITSIVLTASVASSIGINSRFDLYGQKKL